MGCVVYMMQCNCEPQTEDLGKGRRGVFFNYYALYQSWFLKEESLWLQILKINALSYPSLSLRIKHSQRKLNFNHHSLANRRIEDQAKARSGKKNEFGNSGRTEGGYVQYVCMCSCIVSSTYGARGMRGSLRASKMRIGRSWGLGGWDCNSKCASNSPAGPAPTITVPAAPASAICLLASDPQKPTLLNYSLQLTSICTKLKSAKFPSFYPLIDRPVLSQTTDSSPPKSPLL